MMSIFPYSGKPGGSWKLTNIPRPFTTYYVNRPEPAGGFRNFRRRGLCLDHAFNETNILAITQAICLYRKQQDIGGTLYIGIDRHGLPGQGPSGRHCV
jgi:phosphoglucomutase